jgi:hypothetical protein
MAADKKQLAESPLLEALREKRVSAAIVDLDHYRFGGGLAVETDFIIRVVHLDAPKTVNGFQFEGFMLSKTYSAFRTLGNQLKKSADVVMNEGDPNLPRSVQKVAQYAETVVHLVDSQRTQYLGKVSERLVLLYVFIFQYQRLILDSRSTILSRQVNYNYVKLLAKKRRQIIDEIMEATLRYFPDETDSHPFLAEVAQTIETFFLLDHCEEVDEATETKGVFKTPKKYSHRTTPSGHHRVTPSGTGTLSNLDDDDDDQHATPMYSLPIPFNLNEAVEHLGNMGEKLGTIVKQTLHAADGKKTSSETPRATPTRINTGVNALSQSVSSPVVPYTRKLRRSSMTREHDDVELSEVGEEANLLLDDDRRQTEMVPSYSRPIPTFGSHGTKFGDILENNPVVFVVIFGLTVLFLRFSATLTVTLDLDIELLLIFAAFCIGLHTPRPMVDGIDKISGLPPTPLATPGADRRSFMRKDVNGRMLLRKSMVATPDSAMKQSCQINFEGMSIPEEEPHAIIDENQSPMPRFPEGAAFGSKFNCWSEPVPGNFQVRGAKYLSDKKKLPSSGFVFPVRGVDLFLTDTCPENAGR